METVRELLRGSASLSREERAELVKLVWLLGQLPQNVRLVALDRVKAALRVSKPGTVEFLNAVRDLVSDVEEVQRTLANFCEPSLAN